MNKTGTIIKAAAVRRGLAVQISPEALAVLERHVGALLTEGERLTLEDERRRLDGITMRRCLP